MSSSDANGVTKEELEAYQKNKAEYGAIMQKIKDLELALAEIRDVSATLSDLDDNRRCFRVVDSVLVERTVGEVSKALDVERNNLMVTLGKLNTRSRELDDLIVKFESRTDRLERSLK